MKKILISVLIAFVLLGQIPITTAHAATDFYAKVQNMGVNFCSMPSESSAIFEIPQTYFVKIDYIVDDFYKVTYKNLDGYVKRNEVALMNGVPKNPYPTVSPTAWSSYDLYESADRSSRSITELSSSQKVQFYGTILGENTLPGSTDTAENRLWFYLSANSGERTISGYAFNRAFGSFSIPENKETFKIVSEDLLQTTKQFSSLSMGTKIILIVAISVPSVLILYFLIKPTKIMQATKSKKTTKKEPRKIRHGDYYEFDESEL